MVASQKAASFHTSLMWAPVCRRLKWLLPVWLASVACMFLCTSQANEASPHCSERPSVPGERAENASRLLGMVDSQEVRMLAYLPAGTIVKSRYN